MQRHTTLPGEISLQQHFASLQGEQRMRELMRLADLLLKATADGSKILIEYPDGSIGRLVYRQQ